MHTVVDVLFQTKNVLTIPGVKVNYSRGVYSVTTTTVMKWPINFGSGILHEQCLTPAIFCSGTVVVTIVVLLQ